MSSQIAHHYLTTPAYEESSLSPRPASPSSPSSSSTTSSSSSSSSTASHIIPLTLTPHSITLSSLPPIPLDLSHPEEAARRLEGVYGQVDGSYAGLPAALLYLSVYVRRHRAVEDDMFF